METLYLGEQGAEADWGLSWASFKLATTLVLTGSLWGVVAISLSSLSQPRLRETKLMTSLEFGCRWRAGEFDLEESVLSPPKKWARIYKG